MASSKALTRAYDITRAILIVRGQRVILDRELAAIYGVTTKRLNEQVKRNAERFPEDFMFQLTPEEAELSRSQFGEGLRISVDRRPIASHGGPQANECGGPEQQRVGIGACPTATQHLSKQAAHGLDGVSGER
jgi:hypothetical protein